MSNPPSPNSNDAPEIPTEFSTFVMAKTRTGSEKQFETERCYELFGFHVGDRVKTPKGHAWVVGVHNGQLYFQIDGDRGASKWKDCTKKDFAQRGFQLLYSPALIMKQQRNYRAPDLRSLVNNEQFSDVMFVLDDARSVFAMKGILCKRSEYFRALFKPGQTKEADADEVRIEDVSFETFVNVLEYLYTGEVEIKPETAIDLVKAADLFMLDSLKMHVGNYLTHHITIESVIHLLKLADERHLARLKEQCKKCLLVWLKDPANIQLKERFKKFICAENAELVLELTLEPSAAAASSPQAQSNSPRQSSPPSTVPSASLQLPARSNVLASVNMFPPHPVLQYYQSFLNSTPSMLGMQPSTSGFPSDTSSSSSSSRSQRAQSSSSAPSSASLSSSSSASAGSNNNGRPSLSASSSSSSSSTTSNSNNTSSSSSSSASSTNHEVSLPDSNGPLKKRRM